MTRFRLTALTLLAMVPLFSFGTQNGLPTLSPLPVDTTDIVPEAASSLLAISGSGHIAMGGPFVSGSRDLIVVIDPAGRTISRFGPSGLGPGELRGLSALYITDSLVLAVSAGPRVHVFKYDGEYLLTSDLSRALLNGGGTVVGAHGDSVDMYDTFSVGRAGPLHFHRVALRSAQGRRILSISGALQRDTLKLFGERLSPAIAPMYLATAVRIVVGNTFTYTLQEFAPGGAQLGRVSLNLQPRRYTTDELGVKTRELQDARARMNPETLRRIRPLEEQVAALREMQLPHILRGSIGVDHRNRVWVGVDSEGEARADILADNQRRGSVRIPGCFRLVALQVASDRLAASCTSGDGSDLSAPVLRSFKISN
jgi:hypothetical protein